MGIGTDCDNAACSDLIAVIPYLKLSVAIELNRKIGINPPSPVDDQVCNLAYQDAEATKFKGVYTNGCGSTSAYGDTNVAIVGRRTACVNRADLASLANYECHHALIAR